LQFIAENCGWHDNVQQEGTARSVRNLKHGFTNGVSKKQQMCRSRKFGLWNQTPEEKVLFRCPSRSALKLNVLSQTYLMVASLAVTN
jgi:hypothetical protein